MSQEIVDVLRGISGAAASMYDGALDDDGEPIKIGLKREEGNPILDSRTIDGCKVRVSGKTLIVSYHSECKLKDVYATNFLNGLEQTMADIVKFLKKRYRKITGKALSLKEKGECNARVESTSRVRVFVTARKDYEISGLGGVEDTGAESKDSLEASFKKFLDQDAGTKRPKNDKRKAEKSS